MFAKKLYAIIFLGFAFLVGLIYYNGRDKGVVHMLDANTIEQVDFQVHSTIPEETAKGDQTVQLQSQPDDGQDQAEESERDAMVVQVNDIKAVGSVDSATKTTTKTKRTTTTTTTESTSTAATRSTRVPTRAKKRRPHVRKPEVEDHWRDRHPSYRNQTYRSIAKRHRVLKNCTRKQPANKIFLFTYMRGGSSLFGEIFNRDPKVMYWYEVADSFYMSHFGLPIWTFPQNILYTSDGFLRKIPDSENKELASFFDDLFSCRISELPVESLVHEGHDVSHSASLFYRSVSYVAGRKCGQLLEMLCGDTVMDSMVNQCPERIHNAAECAKMSSGASSTRACQDSMTKLGLDGFARIFEEHQKCLRLEERDIIDQLHLLQDICCLANMQVAKIHRLSMGSLEAMIQKIPDIKILYYVRDPRAIAISRRNAPHHKGNLLWSGSSKAGLVSSAITEAKLLCSRMLKDFNTVRELQRKYPGSVFMTRYEDLVQHPLEVVDSIFNYLGEVVNEESMSWFLSSMHAPESGTAYQTTRVNASATAHAWQYLITRRQKREMNRSCDEILRLLGYDIEF